MPGNGGVTPTECSPSLPFIQICPSQYGCAALEGRSGYNELSANGLSALRSLADRHQAGRAKGPCDD